MMQKRVVSTLVALAALLFLLQAGSVSGHAFAPSLLEIVETEPGQAAIRWKQPTVLPAGTSVRPILPGSCERTGEIDANREGTGMVARWQVHCPDGLIGKTVRVEGIGESGADVLLRLALADGRSLRVVLTPGRADFVVPESESRFGVLRGYAELGFEHILGGYDHLLFVFGLVLLVRGRRRLISTVTAFTVGHSMTLALAALGMVRYPQQPIEALIALSIFVLGIELVPGREVKPSLLRRYPWAMAGLFGLLHGLGFAGALTEVGLPQGEIPLALFAFNVGIELGQLAFVVVTLIGWTVLRAVPIRWPDSGIRVPAYAIASLAAFWFFERVSASAFP